MAGVGGELFVRGLVGLASWARIPAGIVATTIAAFATSSPELSVGVNSALAGEPQIALGDALGSNVVNLGLVLGIALLFGPLRDRGGMARREFPFALVAPALTFALVIDGLLSRADAIVLMIAFVSWLALSVRYAKGERETSSDAPEESHHGQTIAAAIAGLVLLIFAGKFIVTGAKFIGDWLEWPPFIVGATLVAFGTSIPELATTLFSRMRGHDEIGLGTVLGSNLFNGLFIVGIAAIIHPIRVSPQTVAIGLMFGLLTVALGFPARTSLVPRSRGLLLLAAYGTYVMLLVRQGVG